MPAAKPLPSQSRIPNPQSREGPAKDPSRISGMFDAIAERYDFLNHLLSAGLDKRWRRQAIDVLHLTGRETVLDLCTGTADLALAAMSARPHARRVVGVDFSAAMLRIGNEKICAVEPFWTAPRDRAHPGRRDAHSFRGWNDRRRDDRLRHPQRRAAGRGVPRNRKGASTRWHPCDSGIFTSALVGASQFLLVVLSKNPSTHRPGGVEASKRLYLPSSVSRGVSVARGVCTTTSRRRVWHRACSASDLRHCLHVRRRERPARRPGVIID